MIDTHFFVSLAVVISLVGLVGYFRTRMYDFRKLQKQHQDIVQHNDQ